MAARSGNGADSGRVTLGRARALLRAVTLAAFAAGVWCFAVTAIASAGEQQLARPGEHVDHSALYVPAGRPSTEQEQEWAARPIPGAARAGFAESAAGDLRAVVTEAVLPAASDLVPVAPGFPADFVSRYADVSGYADVSRYADQLLRVVLDRASRSSPRGDPAVPAVVTPTAPGTAYPEHAVLSGDNRPEAVGAGIERIAVGFAPCQTACQMCAEVAGPDRWADLRRRPHDDLPTAWVDRVSVSDAEKSAGFCAVPSGGPPPLPLFSTVSATPASGSAASVAAGEPPVYPD
jgi:hypothetical protein